MKLKISGAVLSAILTLMVLPAYSSSIQSTLSVFGAEDCAPVVEEKLSALSIKKEQVTEIYYIAKAFGSSEDAEYIEFEGWVSFASCPGNIVINLDNACFISQTYARGGCNISGQPIK